MSSTVEMEMKGDAEASYTFSAQAGKLKVGEHVVISNRPCKIRELRRVKNGKHGAAVIHMVGVDMFTGRVYEGMQKAKHNVECPDVSRTEHEVMDVDSEDGFLSLVNSDGTLRSDLCLPDGEKTSDVGMTKEELKDIIDGGEAVVTVVVMAAMGIEAVTSIRAA